MDEAYEAEKARQARLQDAADFNNETAGVSTGRALRFTSKDEFQRRAAKAKGEDPDSDRIAERMLVHLAYEQTYQRLMQDLELQDHAADLALRDIDRDIAENLHQRRDMLDRAYRLPDGRRVFRTQDGTAVYDESGQRLRPDEAAAILPDKLAHGPTWEDLTTNTENRERLEQERREVETYKAEGQDLQRRAKAGELSTDELEDVRRQREQSMPERMRPYADQLKADNPQPDAATHAGLSAEEQRDLHSRSGSAASRIAGGAGFPNAPDAGTSFKAAAIGRPAAVEPAATPAAVPDLQGPGMS